MNSGPERYGSWFGDTDGRILYFGLSPFWELTAECQAQGSPYCPLRDLNQPGDHLIGRFDLEREAFLEPLLVRPADPAGPSSVWDVLVHSNGRIYYTTAWDEFGSVLPDGSDVRYYPGAGTGLNELWEGPQGEVYATRYVGSMSGAEDENGAVVVFGPDGVRRREFPFKKENGVLICPKSLAVDPTSGEIWVNSDLFTAEHEPVGYAAFRLSADGEIIERIDAPILAFMSFDPAGRGWFVDDLGDRYVVRIVEPDGNALSLDLGPHERLDLIQDIKHAESGDITLLSSWALNVRVIRRLKDGRYDTFTLPVERPRNCPAGLALGYTAVLSPNHTVFETVYCGVNVTRVGTIAP